MIEFELVSPEKKLFSAPVALVTLPGSEGDFGVLPGHSPFISALRVGIIDLYEQNETQISKRILVSGGLVEVNPKRCTALAEDAVDLADVKVADLETQLAKEESELAAATTEEAKAMAEARAKIIRAKIEVIGQQAAAH